MKKSSKRQDRKALVRATVPEVEKLVKKYSLSIINACVGHLKLLEKQSNKIKKLEAEANQLKRQMKLPFKD